MNTKVGLLINSLSIGGAEKVAITLYLEFISKNVDVTLMCIENDIGYVFPNSSNVIFLSNIKHLNNGILKILSIPFFVYRLKKEIKKLKFDVVISHLHRANYINILAQMIGSRHRSVVVNHSNISFEKYKGIIGTINLFLIKKLYPKANKFVAISKEMLSDIKKYSRIDQNGIVIYNPHDNKSIESKIKKSIDNFKFANNKKYIIYVGRLNKSKRVKDVLLAFKMIYSNLTEVELLILGDGDERKNLEFICRKLGLWDKVHFWGNVQNPYPFISKSDILVLASETEGLPNVLIEAMYCKTAIIASDCPTGPFEIINPGQNVKKHKQLSETYMVGECGLLYPISKVKLLVECINYVFDNPLKINRIVERAFTEVKKFNQNNIVNHYIELLDSRNQE